MAYALNNMGVAYADRRMPDKAQEMFKRALDINTNILHADDNRLAINFGNQGYALLKAGNYLASEEMLKRALNLTQERTGENIVPVASGRPQTEKTAYPLVLIWQRLKLWQTECGFCRS